jgi:signal transduction histidine kinase
LPESGLIVPTPRLFRTPTFRLAAIYLALFGASVLVLLAFVYATTIGVIERQMDATIDAEVKGLAEQYEQWGVAGLGRVVRERSAENRDRDSVYLLTDPFFDRLAGNLSAWPEPDAQDGQWIGFGIEKTVNGAPETHRVRALTFVLPGRYRLLVGRDLDARERFRAVMVKSLAWALAATLVLGLAGGLVMSRNMLRRLESINRTSRRIIEGDLHERVPVSGRGDEFDRLSENLNEMLDRLERLMAGMREVTDNVAHDLKSPLARLKARLEVALMEHPDTGQYRAAIERTIAEADRMLATFNALLSIAEIEAGAAGRNMGPVNLSAVANDAAELYGPVAEEKGVRFNATVKPVVTVRGNRELLFQALVNLLDNAIKYTPAGGRITLTLDEADARTSLAVADSGPGIPAEARGKVLDRYVRLNGSRTMPGSGLGLSLVAAVAKRHGAQLALRDNHPGLEVTLSFAATPVGD